MTRVLVVDDEENIRLAFRKHLTDAGYEVVAAAHTIDSRAILSANEVDVAVIDHILQDGQRGLELVKHIGDVQPFCETILISGYHTPKSVSEALQHGTFACLAKPVKKEELLRVVKEAVQKGKRKQGIKTL